MPTWEGGCGFCLETTQDDETFRLQHITMQAGVGTHMDAPSHLFPNTLSIDEIPLENLISPICVIDVSKQATADYTISTNDIRTYETAYGRIQGLVIGYTGWDRFWPNPEAYRNVDSQGQRRFPSFSKEAAELLLSREIAGIAIDTLSPDCNPHFPVHRLILGAGKYIIENIANASLLPPKGAHALSLPLFIQGGSEAPTRVLGLIPNQS